MGFIAVVSMVRNEADVIESFVRHNLGWADRLYVAVHESTDETLEILQALQGDGLPLRLSEVRGAAQLQSEVITTLMHQAAEEGASFIVPLDADEFLLPDRVKSSGQSVSSICRNVFAGLEEGKVYALPWVRYVPQPGKGFLLSRPAKHESKPESLAKILVGGEAVKQAGLSVSQGSHLALLPGRDGERQAVVSEPLSGVHIAHYPWRSEAQAAAKAAVGWLGNVAKYSRYTRAANQWREGFRALLKGRNLKPEPLKDPVKAARLAGSEMVRLCYTPQEESSSLLVKLMLAAEKLAEECAELRVLREVPVVTIVIHYNGDLELFSSTLASAVAEDYPAKEFVVLAPNLAEAEAEPLESLLAEQPVERIDLLSGLESWDNLPETVRGEFLQWLPAGCLMPGDRLTKMVAALFHQPEYGLMMSAVEEGDYLAEKRSRQEIFDLDTKGELFMPGDGSQAAQAMHDAGKNFPGGLAAAILRRSQLEDMEWPQGRIWLEHEGRGLLASLLAGHAYGYVSEPLLRVQKEL